MKLTYAQILSDGGVLQSDTLLRTPVIVLRRCTGGIAGVYRFTHPGHGGPNEWVSVLIQDLHGELAKLQSFRCANCYNASKGGCPARQQVLAGFVKDWKPDCKQHALFLESCLKRKK